jgi:hypothetical protein
MECLKLFYRTMEVSSVQNSFKHVILSWVSSKHLQQPIIHSAMVKLKDLTRTILSQLRAYLGEHQNDWDLYHGALTYSCNNQIHSSTGVTPFELLLNRPPHQLAVQTPKPTTNKSINDSLADGGLFNGREEFIRRLRGLLPRVRRALEKAGQQYKADADRQVLKHQVADLAGQRV